MRRFVRFILLHPILWLINRFSSDPDRGRIFEALSALKQKMETDQGKKGFVIPFDLKIQKFIIFSDQHKGAKNGADDFMNAEPSYLKALEHYHQNNFHFISLGDCEELWENTLLQVRKNNKDSFQAEGKFLARNAFTKIFGNHDLDWEIDPLAPTYLKEIYHKELVALEGVILRSTIGGQAFDIFCTHGHQGDLQSDGNWFSKFFVSKIWAPLQAYLLINPNTPAYDKGLKTLHNSIMYEWSSREKNLILITGHTHQPVFESLTHVERLARKQQLAIAKNNIAWARAIEDEISWRRKSDADDIQPDYLKMRPSYFNSGCCCYADGDITGIEIADGFIRLVKWKQKDGAISREVLEESKLEDVVNELRKNSS